MNRCSSIRDDLQVFGATACRIKAGSETVRKLSMAGGPEQAYTAAGRGCGKVAGTFDSMSESLGL